MSIFDRFRRKNKVGKEMSSGGNTPTPHLDVVTIGGHGGRKKNGDIQTSGEENELDEEYQIPSLHRRQVPVSSELIRRRKEEELRKKYCVPASKEGNYI